MKRTIGWELVWCCCACLIGATLVSAQDGGGAARLGAWEQHQKMACESIFRDLKWQAIGPKFAGGRIESIDAPRGQLGIIYVGVGAGGVWKTENGGLTWRPIFENESTYAIGDLTIAPSDPQTIWVGTGECHLSGSSYPGNGVFKSTDGGETWANMGLHESAHIGKVVIHPTDPNTVFVASMGHHWQGGQRGVFKTVDGGKTFRRVLHKGNRVAFVDLVMDPNAPNRLYASGWDRRGPGSGLFRSEDGGETWEPSTEGLPEIEFDRIALDASKSQPGVVYALGADRTSPDLARRRNASILFRSDDFGKTWKRTHEGYVPTYVGWDFCDVRVAPDDANRVYVGGIRLIISKDGGKTFQGEGGMAFNKQKDHVFRLHHHRGIGLHLDVHDIWIDSEHPERVLLGNDGGLFVSWNRAETWLHLNNLPIAEFYRIHLDRNDPYQVWGGTQDNASFVAAANVGLVDGEDDGWQQVFLDPWTGGDGFGTFPDPHDPKTTYYTQQNGDLKRSRLGRLRADKRIRPRAGEGESRLQFAWDTPFFASQHGDQTVLYCAAQRVMRSTDRGDTWEAISPDLTKGGLLALVESPLDPKRLVAAGGRGQLHWTIDGGETWNQSEGLPAKTVRDVFCSPHEPDRVWVALSGRFENDHESHLYRTDDFGKTWKSVAGNLPAEPANAIAEDPVVPGLIFAGTDSAVYVSVNGGAHWESLRANMPTAPVVDLALHASDTKLFAATHGLSLFRVDIVSIREQASKE